MTMIKSVFLSPEVAHCCADPTEDEERGPLDILLLEHVQRGELVASFLVLRRNLLEDGVDLLQLGICLFRICCLFFADFLH